MSTVLLIVIVALMALAALAAIRLILTPRSRTSETLGQIGEYGFSGVPSAGGAGATAEGTQRPRTIGEAAASLGDALARRQGGEKEIRHRLVAAGLYNRSPLAFVGVQALTAAIVFMLWLVLGAFAGVETIVYLLGMPAALLGGWTLPSFFLSRRISQRYAQIDKELPNLIDLLVVMVEAGVGFSGALRIAADQLRGPLGEELRLTVQEQNVGVSAEDALTGMANRADTPGVRGFARAIVQGELLGVSIAQILRNLAIDMRKKRKARAEEQAQKAPVKMLFPLVLLIFPAMFVVLLLPALISIRDTLGS